MENLLGGMAYLFDHGLDLLDCSGVYETEPVGVTEQPLFYNIVVHAATRLEPFVLLDVCQQAEKAQRRERGARWGPRTLDVDVLLYNEVRMDLPELTIPHPRMRERAFVLGPLEDIDPEVLRRWDFPVLREGIVLQIPAADVKMGLAERRRR